MSDIKVYRIATLPPPILDYPWLWECRVCGSANRRRDHAGTLGAALFHSKTCPALRYKRALEACEAAYAHERATLLAERDQARRERDEVADLNFDLQEALERLRRPATPTPVAPVTPKPAAPRRPAPQPVCAYPDCGRPHKAKGLCAGHYQQRGKGPLRPIQSRRPRATKPAAQPAKEEEPAPAPAPTPLPTASARRPARASSPRLPVLRIPAWSDQAACVGEDPEWWYPERGRAHDASAKAAQAICATCPMREKCLEDAIGRGEQYGIWGGLSQRERRALKAERQAAA